LAAWKINFQYRTLDPLSKAADQALTVGLVAANKFADTVAAGLSKRATKIAACVKAYARARARLSCEASSTTLVRTLAVRTRLASGTYIPTATA